MCYTFGVNFLTSREPDGFVPRRLSVGFFVISAFPCSGRKRRMEALINEFKLYFLRNRKFPQTIKAYSKLLDRFFREQPITEPTQITMDSVNSWIVSLCQNGAGTGYIANMLWAIRAFVRFLKEDKKIATVEQSQIRVPEVKAPETVEYLEQNELEQLYNSIDLDDIHGLRMRTFIEVMRGTGLRPTETLSLTRDQIEGDETVVVGKGGKTRKVYLTEHVREWARKYLDRREDSDPHLFVTHCKPKQWTLRTAEQEFLKVRRRSGIPDHRKIVLHTLRHTFATDKLLKGCPADYIKVFLGHSKVETTRKYYLSIQDRHAKEMFFKYQY